MHLLRVFFLVIIPLVSFVARGELSLEACLLMGLEGNRTLQVQRLQLASASADVMRVTTMYDTRLMLDADYQDSELPPGSFPSQGGLERGQATARLGRGFSSGTTVGLELDVQRNVFEGMSTDDEPLWRTSAGITLRQSLWRNAWGHGQQAQESYVRQRLMTLQLAYERTREEVAAMLADTYWRALTARELARTQEAVLQRLHRLYTTNRSRVEEGLLNEAALLAVEAALAVAEVDVEKLRHEAATLDEQLKEQIDLPVEAWDRTVIDYDLPMLDAASSDAGALAWPSAEEAVATALAMRADVEALRREQERVESLLRWKLAEDRSDLEVSGAFGRGASGASWDDSLGFDQNVWSVGVMLDLSIERSATRADVMQARLERERIRVELEQQERTIVRQCRAAVRDAGTASRLVAAAQRARDAQARKLELEVERYQRGQSDTKTLLDYENDLEWADRDAVMARGALERARIALRLAMGQEKPEAGTP